MNTTIRSAIARVLYDNRLDPAEFRVIFKHQNDEYWDVPFNYLRFQGWFFQYLGNDTLYPLHRIVAIYSVNGEYLIKRKFNPASVTVKPQAIEIIPNVPIERQHDPFTIARFGWLIIRHLELMFASTGDDSLLEVLGDVETLNNKLYLVRKGYFAGTIAKNKVLMRGASPLDFLVAESNLDFQRIYLFDGRDLSLIHKGFICRVSIRGEVEEVNATSDDSLSISSSGEYSVLASNNKVITLIDQWSKMILSPRSAVRIVKASSSFLPMEFEVSRKHWIYQKDKLALVSDYDTIVAYII